MSAARSPTMIILRGSAEVSAFLSGKPDPDQPVSWVCPDCGRQNTGIYHARPSPCECGEYAFPPVHLPIKGDGSVTLTIAIAEKRAKEIDKEIETYEDEISGLEDEISEREDWISELRKEKKAVLASARCD